MFAHGMLHRTCLEAELGGLDGGNVAARAAANDDDVELGSGRRRRLRQTGGEAHRPRRVVLAGPAAGQAKGRTEARKHCWGVKSR